MQNKTEITIEEFKKMLDTGMITIDKKGKLSGNYNLYILKSLKKQETLRNIALKLRFENYLIENNIIFEKETVYNKIMNCKEKFRADYYLKELNILVEINGGQWENGRHNRGAKIKGKEYTYYERDLFKLNLANKHGFTVFQFTYEMLARKEYEKLI